ncbi:c-type cytochrome [Hyphococcus luteus]|uniref:Cytochrome c family protein n=1 Tax=Hyphococcus luteus TaxID=2058213 RepID=A0A2S7K0Y8_9PROT|nr:cytochrome c family protein [Marinicaulis flavus]PQA86180.1 cytochrome c family protein [Marinicaulis flavus]
MKRLLALAAALSLAACGDAGGGSHGKAGSEPGGKAAAAPASPAAAETPATPAERGRKVFNQCAICHAAEEGAGNRVGPNLFGVVGRKAGTLEGFSYSQAMKNSNIVWNEATLDAYIENPLQYVRGTRMAYAGLRNEQQRADLIAYLKTLK